MILRLGGTSHFWNILEPLGYSRVEREGFVSSTRLIIKYRVWGGLTQSTLLGSAFILKVLTSYLKKYTCHKQKHQRREAV